MTLEHKKLGSGITLCILLFNASYVDKFVFSQVMPGRQLSVVSPTAEATAALVPGPPLTRDAVLRVGLQAFQLDDRGRAVTRLPAELFEMIVDLGGSTLGHPHVPTCQ